MLGHDPERQLVRERGIHPGEPELDGLLVQRSHRLQRVVELVAQPGGDGGVEERLVGEHDVLGGERLTVVPLHVVAQPDRDGAAVGTDLGQGGRQIGLKLNLLVVVEQAEEDRPVIAVDAAVEVTEDRVQVARLVGERDHERVRRGVLPCWAAAAPRGNHPEDDKPDGSTSTHGVLHSRTTRTS